MESGGSEKGGEEVEGGGGAGADWLANASMLGEAALQSGVTVGRSGFRGSLEKVSGAELGQLGRAGQ